MLFSSLKLFSISFKLKFVYKIRELVYSLICFMGETYENYLLSEDTESFLFDNFVGGRYFCLLFEFSLFSMLCISKYTACT